MPCARRPVVVPLLAISLLLSGTPAALEAQIGRVIRRAQGQVERKIDQKVDQAVDQAIECAFDDPGCIEKAKADGKPVVMTDKSGKVMTDAEGKPISDPTIARGAAEAPGTGVWRNYDFVPGDKVWVATDWAGERVGRFPASQLEFVSGTMEIVERDGMNLLEAKSMSVARLKLPATLPEQFTVEFMLEIGAPHLATAMFFAPHAGSYSSSPGDYLYFYSSPGIFRKGSGISNTMTRSHIRTLMPVRISVDGSYVIVYVGSERVGMMPNATLVRGDALEFRLDARPDYPAYIGGITVAVGLDPLYDKLMADGSVTTYGFLFDVGSDKLRPESTPKLEELREMLAKHADLRITLEGHTDATGDDASNLDLSTRRARAVVSYLTANGIGAERVAAVGKGEADPIGDNATVAGRQQNRRVVIRKQ